MNWILYVQSPVNQAKICLLTQKFSIFKYRIEHILIFQQIKNGFLSEIREKSDKKELISLHMNYIPLFNLLLFFFYF